MTDTRLKDRYWLNTHKAHAVSTDWGCGDGTRWAAKEQGKKPWYHADKLGQHVGTLDITYPYTPSNAETTLIKLLLLPNVNLNKKKKNYQHHPL